MKKNSNKNFNKNKIKLNNEKGAIAVIVLFTVLMFIVVLIGTYMAITAKEKGQLKSDARIQSIYETEISNIDQTYIDLIGIAPYDKPYIPNGFIYIEGTWNSGYVIREISTGNEFVWVPCVTDQDRVKVNDEVVTFGKVLTGVYNNSNYGLLPENISVPEEDESVENIRKSVSKYGGFYIARYEAGIGGTVANSNLTSPKPVDGTYKPLSKAGCGVWNNIFRQDAITIAENMIDSEKTGVHSCLISGEAWDTTLQWMVNASDNKALNEGFDTNSTGKGWYSNSVHLTGYYAVNNIYDMAGNMVEFTTENNSSSASIARGGSYAYSGADSPAANRISNSGYTNSSFGFRVVLYK